MGRVTAGGKKGKVAGTSHADAQNVPADMMSQFRAEPDVDMHGVSDGFCPSPPVCSGFLCREVSRSS